MKQIISFDPSSATSGIIDTKGVNRGEQLMLYNDSLVGLLLTFADGSINIIPASWNKSFIIDNVAMDKVQWKQLYSIAAIGYPISSVYGIIYEPDEHVPDVNAGMQRGFQIVGGAVNAQTLTNDGAGGGTQIIEMTELNSTGSNVSIRNDGSLVIADWSSLNGFRVLLQTLSNVAANLTSTNVAIGNATNQSEIMGNLLVDHNVNVTGSTNLDGAQIQTSGLGDISAFGNQGIVSGLLSPAQRGAQLLASAGTVPELLLWDGTNSWKITLSGSDLQLDSAHAAAKRIVMRTNNVDRFSANDNGVNLLTGTLGLIVGTLSRIKTGFTAAVTTGTTVTHGLGVTPSFVFTTANNNFTCFVSASGATTFVLNPSVNGNVWWLAGSP